MTPRDISDYGGPFEDFAIVEDPTTDQSAAFGNRGFEDTAQMSRVLQRAWVKFLTSTTSPTVAITPASGQSQMGTGSAALPTISKTGTGRYVITYPTSWTDGVGTVENIAFLLAFGWVENLSTVGKVQCTVSGSAITCQVFDTTNSPSDLGGGVLIGVLGA